MSEIIFLSKNPEHDDLNLKLKLNLALNFKVLVLVYSACFLSACGSGPVREPCPTVEVERVSTCRAIEKCRDQRTSYGMGVGFGIGRNIGIGISQSQSSEAYTSCIDRDLKDQESQIKIIDKSISNDGRPGPQPGNVQ